MKNQRRTVNDTHLKHSNNKSRECKIKIIKSLTVNNISGFKNEVEKCLTNYDVIKIYGEDIEIIDIAGIQLLFTIKKWAVENKKIIEFDITLNNEIIELHKKSGLINILKTN